MKIAIVVLAMNMFLTAVCLTQNGQDQLTLDRIFKNGEFRSEEFGPARWLDGGVAYTTIEPSERYAGSFDLIRYETESGRRSVLVEAQKLIPAGKTSPLKIIDYDWSPDKRFLLVFTNTRKVWRYHTRGDYWVLDRKTERLTQLGNGLEEATLMFAKFAPDNRSVAYVHNNNVYVEDIGGAAFLQLTHDGSSTIVNGTSDWVYEEEFDLRDGFRWSPDSKSIAYWQFNKEGVGTFYLINNTDSIYSRPIPLPYPKVGTTNSAVKIGVVDVLSRKTTWMQIGGDSRNYYLVRMDWAANSEEVVIQKLNRLQNELEIVLGNAQDGQVKKILTEVDEAWVDVRDQASFKWFDDGRKFSWISERDGWRHVYLFERGGRLAQKITPGNYDVIEMSLIDDQNNWLYFIASPDDPLRRYLFRVPLKGGQPKRLTPPGMSGTNEYDISPDGRWAFHTHSNFDSPPRVALVSLPEHKMKRVLVENNGLRKRVDALSKRPVEFFRVGIEPGVELDGYLIKPHSFNPAKKYPVLSFIYGEPAGQRVRDEWHSRQLWHWLLSQKGYLVMCLDNRGTPAPRGRAWRKSVYKQVGILASTDQAAAQRIIRKWPFVDSTRVATWGWSGGGQMSLNLIFRYPELYNTAMAVAFVSDQRLYDNAYQERYMSLPHLNPEGYREGSPITHAHRLKGNLLIVHGTGDDNVHYQSFELLTNELIRHNKRFTMMSYPNRSHGITEGKNTTLHLFTLLTDYLIEHMPPSPID